MTLRVVGAGVGRTGTGSLKLALEKLLGGPCYHMLEVFPRPEHVAQWHAAVRGEAIEWDELLADFVATVDWPACAFWRELADANPDAIVLLSVRDAEGWWRSCDRTIFEVFRRDGERFPEWYAMLTDLFERTFTKDILDQHSAIRAFDEHNERVRATADPKRLLEWRPGDGWGPICEALGLPVPDEEFPHINTTAEFRARAGWDG